MTGDMATIIRAFDHLIELLEDEGVDMDVVHSVESAKEMFEETVQDLADSVDLD